MASELPLNAPSPRLCHIVKWPDFDGYGFNLHADKTRPGQYIGKVDEDSPADIAGIKEGDRIIEVNGVNISIENHKQVVQRIKAVSNETRLLVVDSETDRWYKSHNVIVRGDQDNIIFGSSQKSASPPSTTVANGGSSISNEDGDTKSVESASSSHSENSTQPQHSDARPPNQDTPPVEALTLEDNACPPSPATCPDNKETRNSDSDSDPVLEYDNVRFEQDAEKAKMNDDAPATEATDTRGEFDDKISLSSKSSASSGEPKTNDAAPASVENVKSEEAEEESLPDSSDTEDRKSPMSTTPSPPPSINTDTNSSINTSRESTQNYTSPTSSGSRGLNLNMTAAEMRAQLASKKKFDPRNDSIDLKKKYQIVQNM